MIMNYLAICTTRQLYQNLRVLVKPPFSWTEFVLLLPRVCCNSQEMNGKR